ncbi:S8 family peptidase [Actinokineospora inagensis]|uniref:S8 family peptidase n=1 Tax=Actinokineospora inagensis TaxID=103730 RepID=UPI000416E5AC|nr:S8 family peptidase [Actinokineospora inagensis]
MFAHKRRRTLSLSLAAVAALSVLTPSTSDASPTPAKQPAKTSSVVDGSYIVVFKDKPSPATAMSSAAATFAARFGAHVTQTYRYALNGFATHVDAETARKMATDPTVAYVSPVRKLHAIGTQVATPSWGLDRVDQRDLPLDHTYNYANQAPNVTAYIIDTGIRTTHQDFGGRAVWGTNTSGDGKDKDCNGHGTHVAGTVGGATYGVAKGVKLIAVKVLDCSGEGDTTTVTAGIDWATANHASGPAVANMSLGGEGTDQVIEDAVRNSISDGITYAIAAGNSTEDACDFTPARTPEAITVGATGSDDRIADFSNFGSCVDVFAPGVSITSAWNYDDADFATIDGTSMAAPHVTGAAALLLSQEPTLTPARVAEALTLDATPGKVTAARVGSPNRLLATNTGNRPGYPVITNPGFLDARIGTAFSLPLTAAGGTGPYKWTASGLPAGLAVNATTGVISGTPTAATTATVTVTATDTANRARSLAFTLAVTPAAGSCSSSGQKLLNPGFETGFAPWVGDTEGIGVFPGAPSAPRSGTRAAVLNGYGRQSEQTVYQAVLVPAGCVHSTLSLYLKVTTEETDPVPYDVVTVTVNNTIVATYSNLDAGPYTLRTFPLGAYAGQAVVITLRGLEDAAASTWYAFDDLTVNAA